jgi:ADP-heptose:LPS heptosyltransferase
MHAEGFDLALQMHGGGRNSNPIVLGLGAHLTAGMKTPDAPALDRWIPYFYWQHEVLRLLEVVSLVGAAPVILEPRLAVSRRDKDEACKVLPDDEPPLVVIHPGASDPRRRWSAGKLCCHR